MKKPFPRGVVSILAASLAVAGAVGAVGAGDPVRGKATGGAIAVYDPNVPEELRVRDGLPNFFAKAKAGGLIFKTNTTVQGKMVFSADGVRPGHEGHDVYRDIVARSMLTMRPEGTARAHRLPAPLAPRCWETATPMPVAKVALSPEWTAVDEARDPAYRDDFGRTHAMLRGAAKCGKPGGTLTATWDGTTLGFGDIPQGGGTEVEVTIDNAATPLTFARAQTREPRQHARFFYLPEQAPGRHTAVLRMKKMSDGTSFYAGQVLVIGTVPPWGRKRTCAMR